MNDLFKSPSRRAFLRGSAAAVAGSVAGAASAQDPDPLITEVQDWAAITGEGVDETPMACRSGSRMTWYAATCRG